MSDTQKADSSEIIPFPFSRIRGQNHNKPARILGYTQMAGALSPDGSGCFGHWCSHWFGLAMVPRSNVRFVVIGMVSSDMPLNDVMTDIVKPQTKFALIIKFLHYILTLKICEKVSVEEMP